MSELIPSNDAWMDEYAAKWRAGNPDGAWSTVDDVLRGSSVSTTPYGDVFNAEALERDHGDALRYCQALGGWYVWVGTHWEQDITDQVMELARQTLRTMGKQAAENEDASLLKYVSKCFSHAKLQAMISQAATFPRIVVKPGVFDTDPWLLNCRNGTIELRAGTLRAHQRTDYITRCLDVDYDAAIEAPHWHRFLWRIMGGSVGEDSPDDAAADLAQRDSQDAKAERLMGFLQRSIGYSLTGITSEDCLFILYGSGRNGKSRFIDTCHDLLSGYAKSAQMSSFLHQDRETVRNDLADLYGVRLVSAIETTGGRKFSEGLLKQLTGGDRIKARFLFKEYFEFLPNFKIFLAFNHKPEIDGTDLAIWERIKTIPFDVYIPPEERDKQLKDKLLAEQPGILAWAVQGCLAWQQDGLQDPEEVRIATEEYRTEMDTLQQFILDCCVEVDNTTVRIKVGDFYARYVEWSEQNQLTYGTKIKVSRDMKAKQYPVVIGSSNVRFYQGIGLKAHV